MSAVHPLLLDLREDILGAKGLFGDEQPKAAETKFVVNHWGLDELISEDQVAHEQDAGETLKCHEQRMNI